MGCAQGKCCVPRRQRGRGGGGAVGGRGGATLGRVAVPGAGLVLEYATLAVAGLYPDSPGRESQDAHLVATRFAGHPDLHLFAVFDGHGACGAACAGFARDALPRLLAGVGVGAGEEGGGRMVVVEDPAAAFREALPAANAEMHAADEVDDSMSGTTAVAALVAGGALHVANVGDSRAVAGVWREGRVAAEELSWDQTPFRADERARVKACGARVMSVEQVEGVRDPEAESWVADEGDPPRVWARDGLYPGTAFTRSLGDQAAEAVGVIAEPEVKSVEITPAHLFFVVASDGVFEFLSSQDVVDMNLMQCVNLSAFGLYEASDVPRTGVAAKLMKCLNENGISPASTSKLDVHSQKPNQSMTLAYVLFRGSMKLLQWDTEVAAYEDPREACSAIAAESYKLWLEHENRTDDITIIIVHIRDSENPGPAGSQKMNGSSSGAVQPELTVFVPSEASHLNRDAATEMPSSSSGSPTEQHLSCVAPSPTHPLLGVGRTSETPKLIESERAMSQPAEASWHQRDDKFLYRKRIPSAGSCCCAMAVVLALQSVRHAPVANPLGAVARVFLRAPAD
ncbi:Os07g0646100 [Oryza sativa Japonica Group]|nr:Os07g0646100 [Oryza sativa Japonica Group]|eukprot:NP_001060460.2 Os07g0646100 [Oryza sativa Japonica Group]